MASCGCPSPGAKKVPEMHSGDEGEEVANTSQSDDRGRVIHHLQQYISVRCCAICKKWNSTESGFVHGMTMLVCDQCGREYHVACLKEAGVEFLELPEDEWFCQKDCKVIDDIMTQLVGNGPESLADSIVLEFLEHAQMVKGANSLKAKAEYTGPTLEWQILCGKAGSPANVKTLVEVAAIFTECLDPIKDAKTGRSLIPLLVHSKRSKGYDFEGIFCVVLRLHEKVVSAALLQVFGHKFAEIPLIATNLPYQKQGFGKALLITIERLLGVLDVKRLVLPAPKNSESIWINNFGFSQMDDQQLAQICTTIPLLTFTGTSMLEKKLTRMVVTMSS